VGNLLLQQKSLKVKMPLDVLGAMTQGQLGYLIQNSIGKKAATVVTEVITAPVAKPTKPIGPYFRTKTEKNMIKEPEGWRKVVISPRPKEILQINQIKELIKKGFTVIACGGGGIPVTKSGKGVKGVIDKDRTSALLATKLKADLLIMLTDVPGAYLNYESRNKKLIRETTSKDLKKHMKHFKEGSMKPKIESAISFLSKRKGKVIITKPSLLDKALRGKAGTVIK
jgi:carbamate kinase